MKLIYQAPRRMRIKHSFIGMTTFDSYWMYDEEDKKWVGELKHKGCSHQHCNSVRAFRRKLKKAPKGVKFILVSRWMGYDVYGTGTNSKV